VIVSFTDLFPPLILLKARRAVVQNPQLIISAPSHDLYRPQITLEFLLGQEDYVSVSVSGRFPRFMVRRPIFSQIVLLITFASYSELSALVDFKIILMRRYGWIGRAHCLAVTSSVIALCSSSRPRSQSNGK
jgi:hypothetical protein